MPIKKENLALYPRNWQTISLDARERAGWKCQQAGCTAHQYAVGWWRQIGRQHVWEPEWPRNGVFIGQSYADAYAVAALTYAATGESGPKPTVIVLTVAHLNHKPEDCRPENLAAMCQRHHLAYDQAHHTETAYMSRMRARNNLELPL